MTNLLEQKKKMNWYDQNKVNEMGFDDSEWKNVCRILDDPKSSQTVKDQALDDYISLLFHEAGVKGY